MAQLMGFLGILVSFYMMIIFIRIVLTWFTGLSSGGLVDMLAKITDPYLNWFRRFPILKVGNLDLSPVAALGVLSVVNRIFGTLAVYKTITIGLILAMVLQVFWGLVSFFLGFLIFILILRLVAHLIQLNTTGPFWRIIDTISQPVVFRINRIILKDRLLSYTNSVLLSIAGMGLCYLVLKFLVSFFFKMLVKLPI